MPVLLRKVISDQEVNPKHTIVTSEYDIIHSTEGREGTTLTIPMKIVRRPMLNTVSIDIPINFESDSKTQEECMDKAIEYMERTVIALKSRGMPQDCVSLYN